MDGLLFLFIIVVFAALLYYAYGSKLVTAATEGEGEYGFEEVGDEMSEHYWLLTFDFSIMKSP